MFPLRAFPVFAARIVALAILAAVTYGQAPPPASADPHEDPRVQNAPEGKKLPRKAVPAPKVVPPKKTTAKAKASAAKPKPIIHLQPVEAETAMIGTWNLVREKSSFQPGPGPQSETRTYSKTPSGIMATVVTTASDGTVQTMNFPWMVDGSEHPVKGSDLLDTIQLKRVDNLTAEASLRHGTKELAKERRALAADGKTMTISVTDMTSEDRPVTVTAVYAKQ
ncbi:MAG: hypothetical protein ABI811_08540 [Acidobacteriota bacterium]